jgi:hypothetical protein
MEYKTFMDMMISNGFAEKIPEEELHLQSGSNWYLTNHLCAARLGIMVMQVLCRELDISFHRNFFWTDRLTVLKYINNVTARFQRFVVNKVSFNRNHSGPKQWRHIRSEETLADLASRETTVQSLINCDHLSKGPSFLST